MSNSNFSKQHKLKISSFRATNSVIFLCINAHSYYEGISSVFKRICHQTKCAGIITDCPYIRHSFLITLPIVLKRMLELNHQYYEEEKNRVCTKQRMCESFMSGKGFEVSAGVLLVIWKTQKVIGVKKVKEDTSKGNPNLFD